MSEDETPDARTASFEEWYPAAHRQVLAALLAYAGDLSAAREAVDEAFARAFARWSDVGRMSAPAGWTFVVARNHLRRSSTRAGRERAAALALAPANDSTLDELARVEVAMEVAEALRELSPRQREVVVLHYGLDLAQDQVGDLLGISRSTVATTLFDARKGLGLVIEEKGKARA
jgi:RNA polymerase sigma-70 factor (ECF subfamily)